MEETNSQGGRAVKEASISADVRKGGENWGWGGFGSRGRKSPMLAKRWGSSLGSAFKTFEPEEKA